jgi:hypothetical protein
MDGIGVVTGAVVLLAGRPLFWLFVGVMGFVVAFDLASLYLAGQPQLTILAIALVAGLVGIILALLLQRVAFGVAGFLAGGYLVSMGGVALGWAHGSGFDVTMLIGGIIGALAGLLLADWALIVFSSLVGAAMIVDATGLGHNTSLLLFAGLTVVGLAVQSWWYKPTSRPLPPA